MAHHDYVLDNTVIDVYRAHCSCGWRAPEARSHPAPARQDWIQHRDTTTDKDS